MKLKLASIALGAVMAAAPAMADLVAGRGASMDLTKFDAARYGRG